MCASDSPVVLPGRPRTAASSVRGLAGLARRLALGGGLLLGLFHGWLFASQAWTGQLTDPTLVARWLVALGLVAALAGLRRRGVSFVFGREAIAVWLLAALLHAPGVIERLQADDAPALPEVVVTLSQSIAAGALAIGLVLLAAFAVIRRHGPRIVAGLRAAASVPIVAHAVPASRPFAPRPPPAC